MFLTNEVIDGLDADVRSADSALIDLTTCLDDINVDAAQEAGGAEISEAMETVLTNAQYLLDTLLTKITEIVES